MPEDASGNDTPPPTAAAVEYVRGDGYAVDKKTLWQRREGRYWVMYDLDGGFIQSQLDPFDSITHADDISSARNPPAAGIPANPSTSSSKKTDTTTSTTTSSSSP